MRQHIVRITLVSIVPTLVAAYPAHSAGLDGMIAQHAHANGVPESLVRRVIARESGYNSRASHAGNFGLMQIRHGTARSMGYAGSASGLLDANTNLTYAVRYLAGAYRAAGGNERRAVALYSRGYAGGAVRHARYRGGFRQVADAAPLGSGQPAFGVAPQPLAGMPFAGTPFGAPVAAPPGSMAQPSLVAAPVASPWGAGPVAAAPRVVTIPATAPLAAAAPFAPAAARAPDPLLPPAF